jgi:hypothetical protein
VFFVGGITCQEARIVNEFNALMRSSAAEGSRRTIRVICGGDFVTSGGRHIADLEATVRAEAGAGNVGSH